MTVTSSLSFFTTEEKQRILTEAHKCLQRQAPAEILDAEGWTYEMPETRSNWNFNTREGQETLGHHDALLHGLQTEAKKPTNMPKITTITPKEDETPTNFYERPCEVFQTYIPFDPDTPKNQWMINAGFVAQSCADIQWKLQKLEGFTGMNATLLLGVANKVFVNQDHETQLQAGKNMKHKASLLASALRSSDQVKQTVRSWKGETQKRPPLCHDQCVYCKETGLWRNECPHRRETSKGLKKFSRPNKERYQSGLDIQNLISLARAESD